MGARSRGNAPVVVPGPGPGTVGMAPAGPLGIVSGGFGNAGMGTSRGAADVPSAAPAEGEAAPEPPAAGLAASPGTAPSTAVDGDDAAPDGAADDGPDVAGFPSGVLAAGAAEDFGASGIGRSEGAGVSEGGEVGWRVGCWIGAAKVPLWGTICGDEGIAGAACSAGAEMLVCPGTTCWEMSAPAAPQACGAATAAGAANGLVPVDAGPGAADVAGTHGDAPIGATAAWVDGTAAGCTYPCWGCICTYFVE